MTHVTFVLDSISNSILSNYREGSLTSFERLSCDVTENFHQNPSGDTDTYHHKVWLASGASSYVLKDLEHVTRAGLFKHETS